MENLALKVANKSRLCRRQCMLGYIFELFDKYKKTDIYFHDMHFDSDEQELITSMPINEKILNGIYLDLASGAFDIILTYTDNRKFLYFSSKCADKAYALYMFYKMNYRITGENSEYILETLLGKTFEELIRPDQRRFYLHDINVHEYDLDFMRLNSEEEQLLKEYINI